MVIFILSALGLMIVYVYKPALTFWSVFWFALVYLVASVFLYTFLVQPLFEFSELSAKRFLLLTFSVVIIALAFTHSVWTVTSPNWSFSVSTDKSSYRLGENIQITVSLINIGFIPHSFTSSISDPIFISISYFYENNPVGVEVWYSPVHFNKTSFTVYHKQSLQRTFTWNQTNIHFPKEEIKPGTYSIKALIPSADSDSIWNNNLFWNWTYINITAI
jgi:hypothetical protein